MLDPIWSKAPEALFFNLNGHTYKGRDHWFRLWEYYGRNVNSSYWTPFDIGGVVSDDMAVVWCHRRTRRNWTGKEPPPKDIHYGGDEFITRSTMVFARRPASGALFIPIFPRRAQASVPAAYRTGGHSARERLFEGTNVSDLPKLSVRLHGGIEPSRCVTLARRPRPGLSIPSGSRRTHSIAACCRRRRHAPRPRAGWASASGVQPYNRHPP
jgi:hypothetical protein